MFKYYPNGNEFALQQDHDNFVLFTGNNDRLMFLLPANDTIVTMGNNQTLGLHKAGDNTSVMDMSHGLTLDLVATEFGLTKVYGFQNDSTGLIKATAGVTLTPDGHGGTLLSGFAGGGSFDFIGDNHLTMAQISFT